ncbi:MAG: hypothetical protein ACK51M_21410, partial [Burkholderiales bacterium]
MTTGPAEPAVPPPAPSAGAAFEARIRRVWFGPHGALDALAGALLWPLGQLVAVLAGGRRHRI